MSLTEQLSFKKFIQIIGKGQRSGRTLTQAESFEAMTLLLSGKISAEQRGAFLMLLRVREETKEEIAGFLQAARDFNSSAFASVAVDLDMPCYAGKRRHLPWLILSIMCLTQTGKTVFIHGTQEPDTQRLYVSDALNQLGFCAATSNSELTQQIQHNGFAYTDLSLINPALDHLIKLRAQLGLRSCANTLARMLNPSNAKASLQGVYHKGLDNKHAGASRILNEANACVFRGDAGEVEVNPERDCDLLISESGETRVVTLPKVNEQWSIKPRALDVQLIKEVWAGTKADNYGYAATISTLAAMLVVTDQISPEQAFIEAKALWNTRDKSRLD